MKTSANKGNGVLRSKTLHAIVFLIAMMSFSLDFATANAATVTRTDYHTAVAGDKFDGTRRYAVALKLRPPRRLRARHLELAIGSISKSEEDRASVSFGPVWRLPIEHQSLFVEPGISPTLIGDSPFNGQDLGGNSHFTSSIAIGAIVGQRRTVSLLQRAQQTSNDGLSDTNPGIDMIGSDIAIDFTDR